MVIVVRSFALRGDLKKHRKEEQPSLVAAAAGASGTGRQSLGTSYQVQLAKGFAYILSFDEDIVGTQRASTFRLTL